MEEAVLRRIELGILPPLTVEVLDQEIDGLYEDLLNFDNGHPLAVAPTPVAIVPVSRDV